MCSWSSEILCQAALFSITGRCQPRESRLERKPSASVIISTSEAATPISANPSPGWFQPTFLPHQAKKENLVYLEPDNFQHLKAISLFNINEKKKDGEGMKTQASSFTYNITPSSWIQCDLECLRTCNFQGEIRKKNQNASQCC